MSWKNPRSKSHVRRPGVCCHGMLYTACGKCRKYRAKTAKILAQIPDECPYCGATNYNPEAGCENCVDLEEAAKT